MNAQDMQSTKGLLTVELDMNLTPEQYSRLYGKEERSKRKATIDLRTRWTRNTIPYEIAPNEFSPEEITELGESLAQWGQLTCLTFRPYTASDKNRIRFQNGRGCNSALGMIGGVQVVNLQKPGCRFKGLYLHEVGHAIGLVHEHQLPERDKYIRINLANVAPDMRQWFNKYVPESVDLQGLDYDYASVMHYGKTAFSYNDEAQTIFAKDKSKDAEIGQVAFKGLSFSDVKAVNLMYRCNESCPNMPSCKAPCFVTKHCKCFCKQDMPKPPCVNKDSESVCQEWAARGECSINSEYLHDHCRKACNACEGEGGENETEIVLVTADDDGCTNSYSDDKCTEWAARAECQKNPDWMASNCRLACKKCDQNVDTILTTPAPTSSGGCTNSFGNQKCNEWAGRDECRKNPVWMTSNCRLACDKCDQSENTLQPTTPVPSFGDECVNHYGDVKCKDWAARGECQNNPDFMTNQCRRSCGRCLNVTTTTTSPKSTTTSKTATKTPTTKTTPTKATTPRPKTTTTKKTTTTTTATTTTQAVIVKPASGRGTVCADSASGCPGWFIYCTTNQFVVENCLKTCNKCTPAG